MNAVANALPYCDSLFESAATSAGPLGDVIKRQLRVVQQHVQDRAINWDALIRASIEELRKDCRRPNWDGHGAVAISSETLEIAYDLARSLSRQVSPGIPAPDLVPEPDGEISLSWDLGSTFVFSISIGKSSQMNYAGLFGEGIERHGMEPFVRGSTKSLRSVVTSIEDLFERDRAKSARRA